MSGRLFSSISLRETTLANRIVVSPMCQYSAVDGSATDWHLVHLGQMAMSGAGLVILEATHVEARGRITPACLGLYSDENEAALVPVLAFCRAHGSAKLGIQLSHAGRKGSARIPWETGAARPWTPPTAAGQRAVVRASPAATAGRCRRTWTRPACRP